ncbi:MAG: NADH-quinone oxidoreductase subunit M [Bacteroidia bacterium]|nr:NADH-quinone oxidoreductase subunit M [Bacteroidia bacterium]
MMALLLFVFPLLAGFLLLLSRMRAFWSISFIFSLLMFAGSLSAFFGQSYPNFINFEIPWVPSIGSHFHLNAGGVGSALVLLTGLLYPIIFIQQKSRNLPPAFFGMAFIMQAGLNGVFMARDAVLFYVCWELALIPIYLICLMYGGQNRETITLRFFIYTVLGSLFMLAGLIYLYTETGSFFSERSFSHEAIMDAGSMMAEKKQILVYALVFMGFVVKIPLIPFHVWQPSAYTNTPFAGTMLLSGLMAKMGTFGYLFWLAPTLPLGHQYWSPLIMALAVITILFAAGVAIVQKDFKELLAWSSLSHMAMMAAGITSLKEEALSGSVVMMFSHGLTAVGLFVIADILERHTGTTQIQQLGGIRSMNGQFSNLFLIVLLGSVALPLTSGFPGEFLILSGIYQYGQGWAVAAALSVILGAVYMLRSYQRIMLGEPPRDQVFKALESTDKWALMILCALIILLGVYPNLILNGIKEGVGELFLNLNK